MEDIVVTVLDTNYIPEYETKEEERRNNEEARTISENERIQNENIRMSNEEVRQTNETNRITQYNLIQSKLDNGEFNGEDGYSPTVTTSKVDRTTTITITDKNGEHTATILDGEDGSGSSGGMKKEVYDTNDNGIVDNAEKVNNHTVQSDVPANAVFTDTVFSGNYEDLTNKPTIPTVPTNVSSFTNDAGYLTSHQDISGKQDTLISGTNIKTINNESILGNGNIEIQGGEVETIYLGDVEDFKNPGFLDLTVLKKGYYLISCNSYNPIIRLKAKNGENEFFASVSFSSITATDKSKENVIYLYVDNEITESFSEDINFGKFSYEIYSGNNNYLQFRKVNVTINTNSITTTSSYDGFNLLLTDKAQTVTGKKTFTTLPESSVVPTTDEQLVNKKYVDDNAGGGASYTAGDGINIANDVISTKIKLDGSDSAIALGNQANPFGGDAVVIGGQYAQHGSIVIGINANAFQGSSAVVIGYASQSSSPGNTIIGYDARNLDGVSNSIALGRGARVSQSNQFVAGSSSFPINTMKIITSSGEKTLATTDYLTTITGYDATKTQVLKNVNGTFTWVDE